MTHIEVQERGASLVQAHQKSGKIDQDSDADVWFSICHLKLILIWLAGTRPRSRVTHAEVCWTLKLFFCLLALAYFQNKATKFT